MLKHRAIPVVIILAILLIPILIITVLPEPVPVSTPELFQSERSKRMDNSYGHPDLFAAYHAAIRTAPDGTTYPSNYRMAAFNEAIAARKNAGNQLPWIERGPGNVPSRTRALVVDPSDPSHSTWFVGSVSGGVWKTSDEGRTWRSLTDHLPNLAVGALAIANSDPDILYMGTGEGFFNVGSVAGSGIFKSVDRGETWTQLQSTATLEDFQYVNRLAVDPDNADVVLAATNKGIYRSEDGGGRWTKVYNPSPDLEDRFRRVQDLQAKPDDFNIQFATVNGTSVLRSLDAGQTWEASLDKFIFAPRRMELAIAPSNTNVVYVAIEVDDYEAFLYRTMNGGDTWTPILDSRPGDGLVGWQGNQGWYNNTIAVHPFSPDTVYLGGIHLWRSVPAEGAGQRDVNAVTEFNQVDTEGFMTFIDFNASHFRGTLQTGTGNDEVVDVTEDDLVSVDIRFGPGKSQKAHRFTIPTTGGTAGDGGAGIAFSDYMFADYVDVPFEVWDVTNNRQLMVSFRDQANNGEYDLVARSLEVGSDWREMSREYIFIHKYPYATAPMPAISADGGFVNGQLYFMRPILPSNGTWDPEGLPESELQIVFSEVLASLYDITITPLDVAGNRPHVDHHSLTLIPINEATGEFRIINTNDGGVHLSKDSGGRWFGIGRGYNTAQFYGVDKRPGVDVYLGGTQDNGTWRSFGIPPGTEPDPNRGWQKQLDGDGFDAVWHSENDMLLMGSSPFNNIRRSTDGGNNWRQAQSGLSDTGSEGGAPFITTLGNSKARPDVVFTVGASGVWRSDDFGANWQGIPIPANLWGPSAFSGKVRVSLANPDVIWAGFRFSEDGARIHVSRDGGTSFEPVSMPAAAPNRTLLSGMATHPHEEGTAYMLYSRSALYSRSGRAKILRTTDFGETWDDPSDFGILGSTRGFPDVAVYDLLIMPHNPDIMWAGTEIGLFVTEDGADSWEYSDNGFPAASIWRMRLIDQPVALGLAEGGVERFFATCRKFFTIALTRSYPSRKITSDPEIQNSNH